MPHMTDLDIEHTLIDIRGCLLNATDSRKKYDTWKHNLCFLSVLLDDHRVLNFVSYSDQSTLSGKNVRLLEQMGCTFVPTIDYNIEFGVNCGGMGQYHTEPKLFRRVLGWPGLIEHIKEIIIASEINVCRTCMPYTLNAFKKTYPSVVLTVKEYGMNPGAGKLPTYPTFIATQGFDPFAS